jgi:regulator of sigma E protease
LNASAEPTPEQAAADPRGWLRRNGPYLLLPVLAVLFLSYHYDLDLTWWTRVGIAALGLGLVIFVHELGHFLVAKWCDVHVEVFSIGFGPPLPGCCFKRGETTYMIALFPLGGYVKMVGEGADNDENDTDPRSFKNKSVWQRMAIISAGVTMNLILAFLCFVFVFRTHGDEQTPSVVNVIDAGSPAWKKGMRTGDVVYWIDDKGPIPSFEDQLTPTVMNSTEGEALRFVFGPPNATEEQLTHTQIVPRREENDLKPTIGISAPDQLTLRGEDVRRIHSLPVAFHSSASRAEPAFQFADKIVGTSDPEQPDQVKSLPPDPRNPEHHDYFEFYRRMVKLAGRPMIIQVKRQGTGEVVDIRVPPAFHQSLGMRMRMGRITAVRDNSPSAAAGVQPDDIIEQVEVRDGADRLIFTSTPGNHKDATYRDFDPIRLPHDLSEWAQRQTSDENKKVTLTVLRKSQPPSHTEFQRIKLTLDWDGSWWGNNEQPMAPRSPMSVPGLGLAYRVETTVADVKPGSSAQKAGVQKDDIIKAVRFYDSRKTPDEEPKPGRWHDLAADQWAQVEAVFQASESKKMDIRIDRDKAELSLTAEERQDWPVVDRGLLLIKDMRLHRAENIGEAVAMGVTKTKNFIMQIYGNLRGIVMGRISTKLMGGPIMIGTAAFHFASDIHRFIVFIGIISVNLAVLNFLPIPVLDGGHMMFLLYEKLRGKPAPERVRVAATMAGLAALLLLMAFVIYLDVSRLIF